MALNVRVIVCPPRQSGSMPREQELVRHTLLGVTLVLMVRSVCGSGAPLELNFPSVAWYGYNSNNETHTVAGKLANPLGLYDVHGNV